MTPLEVAALLQVTRTTIYKLVRCGKIPAYRVGGAWRLRRDEFTYWLSQWARSDKRLFTNAAAVDENQPLMRASIFGASADKDSAGQARQAQSPGGRIRR